MKLVKLQEYGNYSVVMRQDDNGNPIVVQPFVVACGVNEQNGEVIDWAYGHYFDDLFNATDFARARGKNIPVQYYRLEEIAGKAIDGLIEDDMESAYEYLAREVEMDDKEAEYFGLNPELISEWK